MGTLGCDDGGAYYGLTLRVGGDYNNWNQSEQAPTLDWDAQRGHYAGVVELPGDELSLRLFAPRVGRLVGASDAATTMDSDGDFIPAIVPAGLPTEVGQKVNPFHVSTPVAARYRLDFDPAAGWLHIDLADDAESGQPPETALLISQLRGADVLSTMDQAQRGLDYIATVRQQGFETPLRSTTGTYESITLVHLGAVEGGHLSVVGDFNSWAAGHDPMHFVLGGRLAFLARRTRGVRIEYRFDRDGTRYPDPLNPEIVWDGAFLPPNPTNLLGGNQGDWNSVAFSPGYIEQGPRLRRLPVPAGPLGISEVFVYLPPGYDQSPSKSYPTLYVHDGKDAIVRGQYDRSLYLLGTRRQVPPLVAVFISAPSDPVTRLSAYASFPDPAFPEVTPQGGDYGRYLLDTVLPAVEKTYRGGAPRAMLGIDMAGPFSYNLAWTDDKRRFTRIASQSGRFGWGDMHPDKAPYLKVLAKDISPSMSRLSFDWCDGDHFQAQIHDAMRPIFSGSGYSGKVSFRDQTDTMPDAWGNLRARAEDSLTFLLKDLVPPQK